MKKVEFYFDYGSPWAYLASEIAPARLGGAEIVWRPIYLRGTEGFAKGLPYSPAKLQYLARDFARCAAHEGVRFAPPAAFPFDGLAALRAALVAQDALDAPAFARFHRAIFRGIWADQRDLRQKESVAALLAEALGAVSTEGALAKMEEPAVKERLREATAAATERGLFGVPTFFVGDEMFWGHDRLEYVARASALD